jgi:hypothetical protein
MTQKAYNGACPLTQIRPEGQFFQDEETFEAMLIGGNRESADSEAIELARLKSPSYVEALVL